MARLVQHKYEGDFTVLGNAPTRDHSLSYKALGMLWQLLSVDAETWNFSVAGFAAIHSDGRDSVTAALKELEQNGYLFRDQETSTDGQFGKAVYHVFAEPRTEGFDLGYEGFVGAENSAETPSDNGTQNRRSEPKSENPTTGMTSENADPVDNFLEEENQSIQNRRSEPLTDFPSTGVTSGNANNNSSSDYTVKPQVRTDDGFSVNGFSVNGKTAAIKDIKNKKQKNKKPTTPSHKGLVTPVSDFGGVVGVDDFSEDFSAPSPTDSAPSALALDDMSDSELASRGIERFNAGYIVGQAPKKKEFVNAVVDRELLDKALPASWLGRIPHNAQARLSRDITGWVAKGGNPSDIRRRLEDDALPPVIKNFSGLVIHRVSQALEAVSPLSREEKKQARRSEIRALAEGVLGGSKKPSQRVWTQLSAALNELNSSSDSELYGLVEQAYHKVSDILYSHV